VSAWQPPLLKIVSLASLQRSVFAPATYADPVERLLGIKPVYQPLYDFQTRQPFTVRTLDELQQLRHKLVADVEGLGMPATELYLLLLYPDKLAVDDARSLTTRGRHRFGRKQPPYSISLPLFTRLLAQKRHHD